LAVRCNRFEVIVTSTAHTYAHIRWKHYPCCHSLDSLDGDNTANRGHCQPIRSAQSRFS